MKSLRPIFLATLAISSADAQLSVSKVEEVARNPYLFGEMAVADMDGDSDTDLIVQGNYNSLTFWCENLGGGQFAKPVRIPMEPRVFNFHIPFLADLDGDGRKDLCSEGALIWTRNLGSGQFAAPQPLPGTTWPVFDPESPGGQPEDIFTRVLQVFPGGSSGRDRLLVSRWDIFDEEEPEVLIYGVDPDGSHSLLPILADGEEIPYLAYSAEYNTEVVDFEGDGDYDFLWRSDTTLLFRNRGDFSFDSGEAVDSDSPGPTASFGVWGVERLQIPGRPLPALVFRTAYGHPPEEPEYLLDRIQLRTQTNPGGGVHLDAERALDRIDFGFDGIADLATVPGASAGAGDELWVRKFQYTDSGEVLPDRLLGYRYTASTGFQKFADLAVAGIGYGEIFPMSLSNGGPPGLAMQLSGIYGGSYPSEDKVVWASLESLRAGTPQWQVLAGPFNDFKVPQVADLDGDGAPDLIAAERDHGGAMGKSGRLHLIRDLRGVRTHRVLDTAPENDFGSASPLPGNRVVIGDADGDGLPDLAVSDGPAHAIRLLRNLDDGNFAAPELLVQNPSAILQPLRLSSAGHRYFEDSRIFSQPASAGSPSTLDLDTGVRGLVASSDMDGDGDLDVVSSPCPLGNVSGWGKREPAGNIVSWHFLSTALAREILSPGGTTEIGWLTTQPTPGFQRVRDGGLGAPVAPFPPNIDLTGLQPLWPPLDLDGDGDFDRLFLSQAPDADSFGISGPMHLVWHENLSHRWIKHPEALLHLWNAGYGTGDGNSLQILEDGSKRQLLVGNGAGELFLLALATALPSGTLATWLGEFELQGASSGPESDPDGDGLSNLEEALQGSSPIMPTSGGFRIPVALASNNTGWTFSSSLDLGGSGITAVAEVSDDLAEWDELEALPVPAGTAGERYLYTIADSGIGGELKRFMRLRFSGESAE